jgi:hypothetical protein
MPASATLDGRTRSIVAVASSAFRRHAPFPTTSPYRKRRGTEYFARSCPAWAGIEARPSTRASKGTLRRQSDSLTRCDQPLGLGIAGAGSRTTTEVLRLFERAETRALLRAKQGREGHRRLGRRGWRTGP